MKNLYMLDKFRVMDDFVIKTYGSTGNHENGMFMLASPIDGARMVVVASVGMGWDHVSVSRKKRCPNWPEMDFVKRAFFEDDETVMQLHVPASDHINVHNFCLHLWRPLHQEIPRPPGITVG